MVFGFIGVGTIAAAIVEGLNSASSGDSILLSPRNQATASRLAARFPKVQVAATNQAVLDGCDIVVLSVRPQIAHEVLTALRFRPHHSVISLIPAVTLEYLRAITAPSASVTRAVPLPSAACRQSPTPIFPANPEAKSLFDRVGISIELEREGEFEAFTAVTAIMSSYFSFAGTVEQWMQDEGVNPAKARAFVVQLFQGLAGAPAASPQSSFAELAKDHQTPGGLNEQVLHSLSAAGVFQELDRALDGIRARLVAGR